MGLLQSDSSQLVEKAIRERKTLKVLSETPKSFSLAPAIVHSLLEAAGWAPFHRPASKKHCESGDLTSKVPWRFYLLDGPACRRLRNWLLDQGDSTKVPAMLASAATLIQVTWLPNPSSRQSENDYAYEPTLENMEHIAAASAAIQNLLVAATAREIQTYWSSGGNLRKPSTMDHLSIPEGEILLGSIFLFGPQTADAKTSPGKLRKQRGPADSWSRWVEL